MVMVFENHRKKMWELVYNKMTCLNQYHEENGENINKYSRDLEIEIDVPQPIDISSA